MLWNNSRTYKANEKIVENLEPRSVKKADNINKMKLSGLEAFNF